MGEFGHKNQKTSDIKDGKSSSRGAEYFNSTYSPYNKIMRLQRTAGNQAVQGLFNSGLIQAKLKIGQPNDVYEQEADRVAEQVMRMPETESAFSGQQSAISKGESLIQAKPG